MACSGCGPGGCGAHKRGETFDPDFEGPSDADIARFGDGAGDDVECPECGASVYYDVPLCPRCGHAMMRGESGGKRSAIQRRHVVVAVGAALALAGFVYVSMV